MQSLLRRNIGGLGKEIEDVVRRLLLTRQVIVVDQPQVTVDVLYKCCFVLIG